MGRDTTGRRSFIASLIATTSIVRLSAHPPTVEPYVPKQSDRPEPLLGDETGFNAIFDGTTLNGRKGDPT